MAKKTRVERKEEERRMIAEMEEAMQETASKKERDGQPDVKAEKKQKWGGAYEDITPQQIHCKRCKTLMENGVCPTCGFRIYVPMSKEKREKIRLIVAGVCMAVFVVLFVIMQIQKG